MAELPSYARPTAASINREVVKTQNVKAHKDSREDTESPRKLGSPPGTYILHGYSLSTVAWRSKARWRGSFKFLDLPPELRNRVYEYLPLHRESHYINLCHINPNQVLKTLPPLLATNKQVCDEAGSDYFEESDFVFMINGYHLDTFISWLKTIGGKNRERLGSNRNVILRLAVPFETLTWQEQSTLPHYGENIQIRGNLLSDVAYLVGLDNEFNNVARTVPTLKQWHIEAYVTRGLGLQNPLHGVVSVNTPMTYGHPRPISHYERLLPFLNQMLALFGSPVAEAAGMDVGRHIFQDGPLKGKQSARNNGGSGVQTISLPSGVDMLVDLNV